MSRRFDLLDGYRFPSCLVGYSSHLESPHWCLCLAVWLLYLIADDFDFLTLWIVLDWLLWLFDVFNIRKVIEISSSFIILLPRVSVLLQKA